MNNNSKKPSHVLFNNEGNPTNVPVANAVVAANAGQNNGNANAFYNNGNGNANANANASASVNNSSALMRHFETTHETPGYGSHIKFGNNGNATVLRVGPVTINPKGIRSNYKGTHIKFNNAPAAAANAPASLFEILLQPELYGYMGQQISWANTIEPGFNLSRVYKRTPAEIEASRARAAAQPSNNANAKKQAAAEAAEKARAELEAAQVEIAKKEREAAKAAYEAHVAAVAARRAEEEARLRARAEAVEFDIEGDILTKRINGAPAQLWHGVPVDADEFAKHDAMRQKVFNDTRKKEYVQREWQKVGFTPGPGRKAPIKAANLANNDDRLITVSDDMINVKCTYEHREGVCFRDLYWRMGQFKQHFTDCAHAVPGSEISTQFLDFAGHMEHYQGIVEGQFIARTKGKGKKEDLTQGCGFVHYYEEPYSHKGVSYPALPHGMTELPDADILYAQALLEYAIARDIIEPGEDEEGQAGGRRRRRHRTTRKKARKVHRKKTHRRSH